LAVPRSIARSSENKLSGERKFIQTFPQVNSPGNLAGSLHKL
jgi:hypothetical protein